MDAEFICTTIYNKPPFVVSRHSLSPVDAEFICTTIYNKPPFVVSRHSLSPVDAKLHYNLEQTSLVNLPQYVLLRPQRPARRNVCLL